MRWRSSGAGRCCGLVCSGGLGCCGARPTRTATVTPAGQVTVPLSRSMSKRSLVKRPPGAAGGWVRHLELMRFWLSSLWNSALP